MWRPGAWNSGANAPARSSSPAPLYPNNNSPSPLPGRRPGSRPQLAHRTSSLSLSSSANASTTSLASSVRQQQQTFGLRRAATAPIPSGIRDPLDVLEGILGVQVKSGLEVDAGEDEAGREPDLEDLEDINFGTLSLEEFIQKEEQREAEAQELAARARKHSVNTLVDYEREQGKFVDLHRSIKACDEVLKSVESYLYAFQTDLGVVSAEIETLQNRSTNLNRRLDNRKNVEKAIGPVVEDIALSPRVIRKIVEGEVNDSWVKALKEADRKMKAIEVLDATKVKAAQDVKPELERLTHKAIERVRDFFVAKIKAIRVPGANAQIIQQQGFIRYKELFLFMATHHAQLAEEIGQAYINTMRWYYLSHFQRYNAALQKLKLHTMDKHDTVGQDEPARRNNLLPSLKSVPAASYDPFNIGRRIDTLKNRTAPIMTSHQAEEDRTTHYPEVYFRHFNAALVENACAEYLFITDFFSHKTYDQASAMFSAIFSPTFALAQTVTKHLIDATLDCHGVLLCVRLNQYSAFEMQKRRVPAADAYINATSMLLWPRFQIVMDAHCESLRKSSLVGSGSGRSQLSALGLAATNTAKQSAAPHFLTQRFACFVQGILALSSEAGDDEPVANSLGRLRGDFEAFLTKLSAGIGEKGKRERFLFNNYSLVLTIISDTEGKLAAEQKAHFDALKKAYEA
ncbi:Vps52-domain-containing protein [Morchella conica CCBAS932]|uniref:Vps52-domain-containing protein n=1 Tax=Morchella conica CCBAS932 TaxID=1392247 RepID=A0A3N4KES3_9PEZI|nr:Vps52-domain-containing protein [Morchella conica CCBAS932]